MTQKRLFLPLTNEFNNLVAGSKKQEHHNLQKYILNNRAASSPFNLLG